MKISFLSIKYGIFKEVVCQWSDHHPFVRLVITVDDIEYTTSTFGVFCDYDINYYLQVMECLKLDPNFEGRGVKSHEVNMEIECIVDTEKGMTYGIRNIGAETGFLNIKTI